MNLKKFFRRQFKLLMFCFVWAMIPIFAVPAEGSGGQGGKMFNLDAAKQQKIEIMQKIVEAVKADNAEDFVQAWDELQELSQEAVLAEARGIVQASDNTILTGRGVRVLTSEETKFYQKLAEAMKSSNPKQALSGFNEVLPKTVIDAIFEDITEAHPLLEAIKFENAAALLEYLYSSMDGRFQAIWGKLCSTITKELSSQFHKLSFGQTKLSAFVPVCKAMLDLGPAWLDRYVRTILLEGIANGLEWGIINGRGVAEGAVDPADYIYEPIGMIKDLANFNVATGYADKVAIPITDFSPENYGALIAQLAVGPNLLNRNVTEVILVVNPVDYFTKIMPATIYQTPQGTYARDIFPFPTKVIQSAYVTQGKAILGISKRYLAVLGTGKDGKIEYSDEYKFLEDDRYYLIKLYGTGRPLDNGSFLYLNIANIKPVHPIIRVSDYVDARLSGIAMADELTADVDLGVFNENIHYYAGVVADDAVAGDNNTATLSVTTANATAVVTTALNGTPVVAEANGSYILTLTAGQNVVIITSAVGAVIETYVLVVTYTAIP
jgi:hypothetical protein